VSRLPIRTRLTLAFTAAVAVVFVLAGTFLYVRLERALDASINASLEAQRGQVAALASQADSGLRQSGGAAAPGDSFAQILTADGSVLDRSPQLNDRPLLTAPELQEAFRHPLRIDRTVLVGGESERVRLLASPVTAQDQRLVIVVGASLADRQEALSTLRFELLAGGPAALLAVALAGFLLARAALRPVEAMREQTDSLSGDELSQRVTVPRADDEIGRLGATLNGLLTRLEESMRHERRFVADASHELRTPLALMRTELELALRRPRTNDELVTALWSAAAEAERLSQLSEALLVLARSDDSGLPLTTRPTPVGGILSRVAARFHRRAANEGRTVVVDDRFNREAVLDETRIEQALANLVENALRHGTGNVAMRAAQTPDGLMLTVEDEGDGFDEEFLPRAFERFSRADDARSGGGAGLGLAIVRAIVDAHGGSVVASNGAEHGTTVEITLPLAPVRAPANGVVSTLR
jgi:signal transduction histidine kinase